VQKRPYVLVNMAMTADGKIDTVERRGARISGAADTARVDRLRAWADAVMVGGRTLLAEDPRLTVRDSALADERVRDGRSPQPDKIGVISCIGHPGGAGPSLPATSRFLGDGGGRVIVATTSRTEPTAIEWLHEQGAEVIVHDHERVDLARLLEQLRETGVDRLVVEGGSTLVAALLDVGLVDELQLAVAPLLFGGKTSPTPVGGAGRLQPDAIRLVLAEATPNEDGDVILRYLLGEGAGSER
jgi:2,5-diamino-6-(ribosylamino)-4(3H)-pyrimidinone 5'-phosphate reductase